MWRARSKIVDIAVCKGVSSSLAKRFYGNAPTRVRPVEQPKEYSLRQSEREISAVLAMAVMFVIPLWLFVLSGETRTKEREKVEKWALRQRDVRSDASK